MEKKSEKSVFSSGEVAAFCNVHLRTVIRWIEKGRLKAYKLPGRGNNRIERQDLLNFLSENALPVPESLENSLQEPAQDGGKTRVLIVDDDVNMAKSIQRVLRSANHETRIAHDGFQAGVQLANFQPALITLDLSMPNMNGFAVLDFMRAQAEYKSIKILVISALDDTKLARAEKKGADLTLSKPFNNEELMTKVDELLFAR